MDDERKQSFSKDGDMEIAIAESKTTEARILRKLDVRLIPMLAILYLMSFLDRGNIGNAKIEGLAEDLHMSGSQYDLTCKKSYVDVPYGSASSNTI